MFETLKTKGKIFFNPKNKSALARFFQNPDYAKDSEERRAQFAFLKLMTAVAFIDDRDEDSELNLIKDYAFEHCLSGKEWQEINFFNEVKTSKEKIKRTIEDLIAEIRSAVQNRNLLKSLEELVLSDDILKNQKNEILDVLKKNIDIFDISITSQWVLGIKNTLRYQKEKKYINLESEEYIRNPVACILKPYVEGKSGIDINIIGAKLGLALMMIYSDLEVKSIEKDQFRLLFSKYLDFSSEMSAELSSRLLRLPEDHLEMAYLGEILVEKLNLEERKEFLKDLFIMARSDEVISPYEDRDLRVISKYLLLDHSDFIEAKLSTKIG
jgi:uncharacterized tellurite resistance protein B-like protein